MIPVSQSLNPWKFLKVYNNNNRHRKKYNCIQNILLESEDTAASPSGMDNSPSPAPLSPDSSNSVTESDDDDSPSTVEPSSGEEVDCDVEGVESRGR